MDGMEGKSGWRGMSTGANRLRSNPGAGEKGGLYMKNEYTVRTRWRLDVAVPLY